MISWREQHCVYGTTFSLFCFWLVVLSQFFSISSEFTSQVNAKIAALVSQLGELSTTFTSHALSTSNGTGWPNVTLPYFDQRTNLFWQNYSELVAFAPVVSIGATTAQWQEYAVQHQNWVDESLYHRGWTNDGPASISSQVFSFQSLLQQQNDSLSSQMSDFIIANGHNMSDRRGLRMPLLYGKPQPPLPSIPPLNSSSINAGNGNTNSSSGSGTTLWPEQSQSTRSPTTTAPTTPGGSSNAQTTSTTTATTSSSPGDVNRSNMDLQYFHVPLWQLAPVPRNRSIINLDLHSQPILKQLTTDMLPNREQPATTAISPVMNVQFLLNYVSVVNAQEQQSGRDASSPRSVMTQVILDDFPSVRDSKLGTTTGSPLQVVGFLFTLVVWDQYFQNGLADTSKASLIVEVHQICGSNMPSVNITQGFVYGVTGSDAKYLGNLNETMTPRHEPKFDNLVQVTEFAPGIKGNQQQASGAPSMQGACTYILFVYPTSDMQAAYKSRQPAVYTVLVICVFLFTAGVFLVYDFLVQRRQQKLLRQAQRTSAIVSSLFPRDVQRRIMADAEKQAEEMEAAKASSQPQHTMALKTGITGIDWVAETVTGAVTGAVTTAFTGVAGVAVGLASLTPGFTPKMQMKDFLTKNDDEKTEIEKTALRNSKPIADLFPEATIMFADIVGFTAWSSMREPAQVFVLLER